jgi:hypothetical protein
MRYCADNRIHSENAYVGLIRTAFRRYMKPSLMHAAAARVLFAVVVAAALSSPAMAARIGILSNRYATETAADFNARIPEHAFTAVETGTHIPPLNSLLDSFDVLLVFEDLTYGNSTAVGNTVAAYANTGRAVVIGAFYDQDRSDGATVNNPHGWGDLEKIDPNTTDGVGTPYAPRTLDTATMVRHALTSGISSLTSAKFAGGNQAKPGTTVVAYWQQPNARRQPDPAIAFRITNAACVIQVAIAPNYPSTGVAGTDYGGDFHRVWRNAFGFAANRCVATTANTTSPDPTAIPTLSQWGLALTILLVGALAMLALRRRAH